MLEVPWPILPSEDRLSLSELCARRITQKEDFFKAMVKGDADTAVAVILKSGSARRLLNVAQDAERRARLGSRLLLIDDPALLAILRALQGLMQRACRRATHLLERFPPKDV